MTQAPFPPKPVAAPPYLQEPPPNAPQAAQEPTPYGPWATIGLTVGIYVASQIVMTVAMVVFLFAMVAVDTPDRFAQGDAGEFTEIQVLEASVFPYLILGVPMQLGMVWLFIWARQRGVPGRLRNYLHLRMPSLFELAAGVTLLAALIIVEAVLSWLLQRPRPEFTEQLWSMRAWLLPFMVLMVVVGAPVVEEILFRGFMFEGLLKWGKVPTISITSFVWTIIHIQYGWYELLVIFALGLLLGWLRIWSKSVPLCIILHMIGNAFAISVYWLY